MENSGYYGILGNNFFSNPTQQTSSLAGSASTGFAAPSNASIGVAAGAGLAAAGQVIDIINQGQIQNQIGDQIKLANRQYEEQINQINSNQSIADLAALKNANHVLSTQIAQASANAISPTSSAINAAYQSTVNNATIAEFSNNLAATTARLNTYFNKVSFSKQAQQKLLQSQNQVFGDFLNGGLSIATAMALI